MPPRSDSPIYEALVIPNEALANGGVEILRAGLVDHELYVTARRVFPDPATWGEVLGDITRRLALIYSAEGEFEEKEVLAAIESAFAADLGAPVISSRKPPRRKSAKAPDGSRAKKAAKKTAKTKKTPAKKTAKRKAR
jgi:hypothetical protein